MRRNTIVAIGAALILSGCATYSAGVGTPVIAATDMPAQLQKNDNSLLGRSVRFEHAGIKALADGRKQAFITLSSQSNYDQHLQYRFYWYDANHQQVEQTPWLSTVLHGQEQQQLQSTAKTSNASAFRFYVRQAD
ncbi:YcfL family protein [Celerinatantimonas sp. MCCC 1A17872]|uniref:YcfL family protein n=1 Tax=Celerinatantimonas sp. MCCC 1A17872 TaxID=3177514 RepID=UPI0038C4A5EE